jgi:hypothetical protein
MSKKTSDKKNKTTKKNKTAKKNKKAKPLAKTTKKTVKNTALVKPIRAPLIAKPIQVITDSPETLKEIEEEKKQQLRPSNHRFYVRNRKGKPIGCVVFQAAKVSASESGQWIEVRFGTSTRNMADPWDKDKGWDIAEKRMKKMKAPVLIEALDKNECMTKVMQLVIDSPLTDSAPLTVAPVRTKSNPSLKLRRYLGQMLKQKERRALAC